MAITAIRATRRQTADGAPNESSWTVFASFTVLGLLTTLPTALPPLGAWAPPTPREWLLLVVCGFLGVAAQLLMTSAFGMLTAVGMGIVQQTTVVLTMVGGLLFFWASPSRHAERLAASSRSPVWCGRSSWTGEIPGPTHRAHLRRVLGDAQFRRQLDNSAVLGDAFEKLWAHGRVVESFALAM